MGSGGYVHGYDAREAQRLRDQAGTLAELLHHDTRFPAGSRVLEVGCGVGAQTRFIAPRNPGARFAAIDLSAESLASAQAAAEREGITNVEFRQADLFALPFAPATFDHVFVCFVLEHLRHPTDALRTLRRLLRPGGTLTVVEGDHGSTLFHPDGVDARAAIDCQVRLQRDAGGNACIGRELYPLLVDAGYEQPQVAPRIVYADDSRPRWRDGFTRRTFIPMIEAVRERAIAAGQIDAARFDAGLRELRRTTEADGTFCYTFFKGSAVAPAGATG